MLEITQYSKLPRLLDLDDLPSATRRRQYWRYVHRWRRRLYYLWRQDVPKELNKAEIARGVDDLLAISLLLDYFRRMGRTNFSFIAEVHQQLSHPTVADIAAAFAETASDPFLSAVLGPQTFSNALPVPLRVVADDWQRRLGNATWLLYRDRRIPLSFFGEFHQFCTGNPLHTKSPDTEGRKKRRSRGMFYTPAPIVDYLVATTLAPLSNGQRPEDIPEVAHSRPILWMWSIPDCVQSIYCNLARKSSRL